MPTYRKKYYLHAMFAVSILSALFDGLFYWFHAGKESTTTIIAGALCIYLMALWIKEDSKDHPEITRPFDYGFFVYLFWPIYFPYYLWRTRRGRGLKLFGGFLLLLILGWLTQLLLYFVAKMIGKT